MPATITRLIREDDSGLCVARACSVQARRLHRGCRGNISLFFILLGFSYFVLVGMVWNTGLTTSARVHTQTAADAAAYSSAVWTSRTMNMVTATNMIILRNVEAEIAATATIFEIVWVLGWWIKYIVDWSEVCDPLFAVPPWVEGILCYAAVIGYLIIFEAPYFFVFLAKALPAALSTFKNITAKRRIKELYDYQKAWIDATPYIIEQELKQIESYYGCEIRVTQPGGGAVGIEAKVDPGPGPPLRQGNMATLGFPLIWDYWIPHRLTLKKYDVKGTSIPGPAIEPSPATNWPTQGQFDKICCGKATLGWYVGAIAGSLLWSGVHGKQHHVLSSQWGPFELGPRTTERRKEFSLVATARYRGLQNYFVGPSFFDQPVAPGDDIIACAQAETYHGLDGRLAKLPVLSDILSVYPWRVWTNTGWQWQPRLARGDQLINAWESDPGLREILGNISVTKKDLDALMLH